ncbi:MAG: hypothetical protein K1X75_02360 [Leptospirales bacterium]|nr:hypothetical protein [Leptospirales bacterium]
MNEAAYSNSPLYRMLGESLPPIARIEQELRGVSPELVAGIIAGDSAAVFLIDYYFRLLPQSVGARIVSAASFSNEAAIDLFNCQIIRYFRAHLGASDHDMAHSSMLESYWREVSTERIAEIFRSLLRGGGANHGAALMILNEMDLERLLFLRQSPGFDSPAMLNLLKEMGRNAEKLLHDNLDLFDFVYRIAADMRDADYLRFLDEFTQFIVQLRVARTLADDLQRQAESGGKPSLQLLVPMLQDIPASSRRLSLELLRQRAVIDGPLADSLLALPEFQDAE